MEAVADTAVVEESAVAPETQESVAQEETSDFKSKVEEQRLYANKYKTIEDLEKGYGEMQSLYNSRYKGFTGAPDNGEYKLTPSEGVDESALDYIKETPLFNKLKERALESGMNNDMFNGIINDYIVAQAEQVSIDIEAEKAKLGKDADARIKNLIDRLGTKFEGSVLDSIKGSLTSAEIFQAWETVLNENKNTVAPPETEVTSIDKEVELQELWAAVDSRGRRKMEYDADYRAMVNKKWKEYYGE